MAKIPVSAHRGAIGAALLLLVAFFLLAAGAVSAGAEGDRGAGSRAGAFILDPSITSAAG